MLRFRFQSDDAVLIERPFCIEQERRAELEKVAKMCDLLEKELRQVKHRVYMAGQRARGCTPPVLISLRVNLLVGS